MYKEKTIECYLNDLSSKKSVPGGGSAAALTGAVSASIICFISNLTIGKKKYKNFEEEVMEILNEALEYKKRLTQMIDEDNQILSEILECYKNGDKDKLNKVSKKAVDFSMIMLKKCVNIMELCLKITQKGNKMLASDFEVAAYTGDAAVNSAIANVKINLKNVNNEKYVSDIKARYINMHKKSKKLKEAVIKSL
ncbi:MAG: cyclodeaminase/cyclohydrolase family protein [Halanaerobiales bacterium]